MDSFTEKKWFVYIGDRHEGPFSLEDIQGKMTEGRVSNQNYVWAEGMADWKVMGDINDFGPLLQPHSSPHSFGEPQLKPSSSSHQQVSTIPLFEEKTGDMDVSELQTIQKIGKESNGSEFETSQKTFIEQEQPEISQKKSVSFRISKKVVFLLIVGGFAGAYLQGYLDPVIKSLALQQKAMEISEHFRPQLLVLSEKFPLLADWVSPIPRLEDVSPEEYEELKAAAKAPSNQSSRIALAISRANPLSPVFYVSSNLPDGVQFKIHIVGKGDTLLDQLSFGTQIDVTVTQKLGKSSEIHLANGKTMPQGIYSVDMTYSEAQSALIKSGLATLPIVHTDVLSELPKDSKVVAHKVYFLGGNKDSVYSEKLRQYHQQLQTKATHELNEVEQFLVTLESQLNSTKTKFDLLRKGKVTLKQRQQWDTFHVEWMKLEGQLDQSFMKWTPEMIQNEFFYGILYSLIYQLGQDVEKVHGFHHAFFNGVPDLKTYEIQMGTALSSTEGSLSLLKSKLEQAKNLQPTANGLPRRDGI